MLLPIFFLIFMATNNALPQSIQEQLTPVAFMLNAENKDPLKHLSLSLEEKAQIGFVQIGISETDPYAIKILTDDVTGQPLFLQDFLTNEKTNKFLQEWSQKSIPCLYHPYTKGIILNSTNPRDVDRLLLFTLANHKTKIEIENMELKKNNQKLTTDNKHLSDLNNRLKFHGDVEFFMVGCLGLLYAIDKVSN